MKRYQTGLVVCSGEPEQPKFPINGAGWKATLSSKTHPRIRHGREVIIYANSWPTAQKALDLMCASLYLFGGDPPVFGSRTQLMAHNKNEPQMDIFDGLESSFPSFTTSWIPIACAIAAKASRHWKWVYGITKYNFSINLYSQCGVDLEPFSSPHLGVSLFPSDHITFCSAILSAYSVIEELGLEVRASMKNPSRIGGQWNPPVKENLEERLRNAKINLDEPVLWTVRGPMRKLERRRGVPYLRKCSWARGPVRDCELDIVDAIAYSDWLRDCVAAHNVKDITTVLTGYDVINVQHVARRLMLESLGFWRWFDSDKMKISTETSAASN